MLNDPRSVHPLALIVHWNTVRANNFTRHQRRGPFLGPFALKNRQKIQKILINKYAITYLLGLRFGLGLHLSETMATMWGRVPLPPMRHEYNFPFEQRSDANWPSFFLGGSEMWTNTKL